jgi:hypothetical protein
MSQTFTDEGLRTWEAFATAGQYGLSTRPKLVFHCISERTVRPRYVLLEGNEADAEEAVHASDVERLRELLREARELD